MKFFASLFLLFGLTAMVLSIDRSFDQADLFLDAALAPSWTDYLTTQKVGYFQDFENFAHVRGTVQTTSALPSVIFRLPEGVAPSRNLVFSVVTFSQSSPDALSVGEVQINKKGEVVATKGKTVFSLDGLSFEVPQKKVVKRSSVSRANFVIPRSYPFSSLFPHPPGNLGPAVSFNPSITSLYQDECPNFKPFWQMHWNATSYAEAATFYCAEPNPANPDNTDEVERVRLRGQFTLLDTTGYDQIAHLPPARQPNKPIRMCTVTPFGAIRVDVTSGGAIIPKGYKSTQLSLDGLEYLVDQVNFWEPITNWQNGFRAPSTNYFSEPFLPSEPYTQPGFKLDSQGKVHLKGIVSVPKPLPKGQIFTLPEGYRPLETIYRCAATRRGAITLSISPLGWVSIVDVFGSVNVEWLSLDGIHFHPERVVPFPSVNGKIYLESNFFNFEVTAEDNQNTVLVDFHEPEEHINFPTKPVTVVGAVNEKLVRATLSLDPISKKGQVEFFDFVKATVPVGADWFSLLVPRPNQADLRGRARVEYAATLPAWQFDRNKNLVLLRGLLYLSENPVLFSLPEWVHVERDFYFLVEANHVTYPIVIHTNGEVTYDGSVSRAQAVAIDLTGIHFSASVGRPPAASSAPL